MEYAIVDIETTGGNASGSRITEIAIVIHDGNTIIHEYETLINPEQHIPVSIFALTGIDNELVANAPIFDTVSEEVYRLLKDRIFVAHNVNFDYSFIKHQLEQSGFQWTAKKLCTVRLSRKIIPGLSSYSLGNLCNSLNISINNRHRAKGDVDATTILFEQLLAEDTDNVFKEMIKKTSSEQRLPPNLPPTYFQNLPEQKGVYYFHDQAGKVIYVGKAINIKKRVGQHFTGHSIQPQRQHFLKDIYSISYEVCGTELMSLLLECSEIKRLWPIHNRALKRFEPKFGLFTYEGMNGYQYLAVGKIQKHISCIQVFDKEYEGLQLLKDLAITFEIEHQFCKYGMLEKTISTTPLSGINEHNAKIAAALLFLEEKNNSFVILDKGRNDEERSCIWIEKGHLYAMGYVDNDTQLDDLMDIKDTLTRYTSNHYMMQLIQSHKGGKRYQLPIGNMEWH